ncbi:MIT domain-containing protein 1-like [Haematobia irritans]|uniref:MIT domain-containing protein 1-like n=1 Tax=Haematobia irritans TaxID=7368 RepID=UPI003F4F4F5E
MDLKEIFTKAILCQNNDLIFEAKWLYNRGIPKLVALLDDDGLNIKTRKKCYEWTLQYMDQAKRVNERIKQRIEPGRILENISIEQNSIGHSFNSLFGKYMTTDVKELYVAEPYLHQDYQFKNLVMLFELAVKKSPKIKFIKLITKRVGNYPMLEDIRKDLSTRSIHLDIERNEFLHDRKIVLSSGYVIKIGRGLHIYKPPRAEYALGQFEYDFRECLKTDVDIWTSLDKMSI